MAKSKSSSNGNGFPITLAKIYEIIENNEAKNTVAHDEIKVEIQRAAVTMSDKVGQLVERIVRIEATPAHEKFQENFCPNTKSVAELSKFIDKHELVHEKLIDELRKERTEWKTERLEHQLRLDRRFFWTIVGMILTAIGSVIGTLILFAFGLR